MKIGVVGAGSLGTVFGAALAREHDVCVLVRDRESARAIERRGGLVVDAATVCVSATCDGRAFADCDIAIVAVKTFATAMALAPLRDVLPASAVVLSLQNGIDAAEHIRASLGDDVRVALAPTTEAARSSASGVATRSATGMTTIGWANASFDDRSVLNEIAAAFSACGLATTAVDDVEPFVWAKLVVNAALNPVTAIARVGNGDFARRADLFERGVTIATEVVALATRSGVALPFTNARETLRNVASATASNRSSMLQDLERGRATEIEAILGAVLRHAAACGLAVPASRAAYDEVRRLTNA